MRYTRKVALAGLVICGALFATRPSLAQFIPGPSQSFGSVNSGVGYGYNYGNGYRTGYGYNSGYRNPRYGYGYSNQMINRPLTYNNINGVAGMINMSISNRGTGTAIRRRR